MERYFKVRVTNLHGGTIREELILCKSYEARALAEKIMEYWGGFAVEYGIVR